MASAIEILSNDSDRPSMPASLLVCPVFGSGQVIYSASFLLYHSPLAILSVDLRSSGRPLANFHLFAGLSEGGEKGEGQKGKK